MLAMQALGCNPTPAMFLTLRFRQITIPVTTYQVLFTILV
jgi:hypothetical protein